MLTLEKLKSLRITATKEKNKVLKTSIMTLMGEVQASLKDGDIIEITEEYLVEQINAFMKRISSNIEISKKNGRNELIPAYEAELVAFKSLIAASSYKQLEDEEIAAIANRIGATQMSDMGKVMNELKTNYSGQFNPSEASKVIRKVIESHQ